MNASLSTICGPNILRELEATQNFAVYLKDQVTELDTAKSTFEKQLVAYKTVAESLQE
jgi:hypothetical protein